MPLKFKPISIKHFVGSQDRSQLPSGGGGAVGVGGEVDESGRSPKKWTSSRITKLN